MFYTVHREGEEVIDYKLDNAVSNSMGIWEKTGLESANKQKIAAGMKRLQGPYFKNAGAHLNPDKVDPDVRTAVSHEAPGTWVKGCLFCNIAANIAYACDTAADRKCLIKEDPNLKAIDELFWEKIFPFVFKNTRGDPTPEPDAVILEALEMERKKNAGR